jgi:uncharacterized protein YndB with AHSA1/START domain
MKINGIAHGLLLGSLIASGASAAVVETTSNGFAIKDEVTTTASAKLVYAALLHDVGKWWNPEHTYSGDSHNLSIDPKVGGCFCERLAHGGGVEHARVIALLPDSLVRLSGAFGPLQSSALAGTMNWTLSSVPGGTKIEVTYNVGGFMHGGFDAIAPVVDQVLGGQLGRLKSFVETGKP